MLPSRMYASATTLFVCVAPKQVSYNPICAARSRMLSPEHRPGI